ncbi:SsgA family sporulation/cell division regulator [Peterkaempfera bronchialis]|uniref:SsgA family sporulation/cell division regulator n=1 Tax=Peterkaempfera bronchialis TaxID=2126346 RepID=A0A345T375_9ACTN|nr:SsgA family sporulation/cell division regulator [Peterkaempfera bronchialis]AXI80430.1 SsgA family sporulation/cell division regulator [Peterkaempfera bronchialis]
MRDPMDFDLTVLLTAPEGGARTTARFALRADAPHLVTVSLGDPHPALWSLPRRLLGEGLFRPCRQGGTRIRPIGLDTRRGIRITLPSDIGDVLLEAPAAPLGAWLERALRHSPLPSTRRPRERPAPDWDQLLYPVPLPWQQGGTGHAGRPLA